MHDAQCQSAYSSLSSIPQLPPAKAVFLLWVQATTVSPWVVTPAALEPFKCSAPEQQPAPLPHLQEHGRHSYDISLAAEVLPHGASQASTVTRTNFKHL